ncbi:MAG: zinc-binding dehydrogenase [Thermoplasmataceae archaeon]
MKAAVLKEIGKDLVIEEFQIEEPLPDQVTIEQEITGICYRDILEKEGYFPRIKPPVILGHEISGIIRKTGENVNDFQLGDRVSSLIYEPCGSCVQCVSGKENLCSKKKTYGENINGSYSRFVNVSRRSLVKVPNGVSNELSAIAACVTGMIYHALVPVGKAGYGTKVVITGAGGGVGSHAIQVAKALGCTVTAVTSSKWKEDALYKLGSDYVIGTDGGFEKEVKKIWPDGAELVLENTGTATFSSSLRSLSFGGRIIVIGNLEPTPVEVPLGLIILKGNRIEGTISSTRNDLRIALELSRSGKVKEVKHDVRNLLDVNNAFSDIKQRKNLGRIMLKLP